MKNYVKINRLLIIFSPCHKSKQYSQKISFPPPKFKKNCSRRWSKRIFQVTSNQSKGVTIGCPYHTNQCQTCTTTTSQMPSKSTVVDTSVNQC